MYYWVREIFVLCGSKTGWAFWKCIHLQFLWARTFSLQKLHYFGTVPVHMLSVSNAISRDCPSENITLRSFLQKHRTFVPSFQWAAASNVAFKTEIRRVTAVRGDGSLLHIVFYRRPKAFNPVWDLLWLLLSVLMGINWSESGPEGSGGIWALAGGFHTPFWCWLNRILFIFCVLRFVRFTMIVSSVQCIGKAVN